MKKFICIFLIIITVLACKKLKFEPEGPTDVRVRNISSMTFDEVVVNTSGGIHNFGSIKPGDSSVYFRFEKAYPKAEVSARINDELYSTGSVDYTYMNYMGQMKITYKIGIENTSLKKISVNVVPEEPLTLK
jgi:hypothetical protein